VGILINIDKMKNSKYIKWMYPDGNIGCAEIRHLNEDNTGTANYFRNGKLYAPLQGFKLRNDDIFITEKEFNKLVGFETIIDKIEKDIENERKNK